MNPFDFLSYFSLSFPHPRGTMTPTGPLSQSLPAVLASSFLYSWPSPRCGSGSVPQVVEGVREVVQGGVLPCPCRSHGPDVFVRSRDVGMSHNLGRKRNRTETETAVAHSICMLPRSLTYQKMPIDIGHLLICQIPM